ncbi:LysM peptidoglycan-binding domain-containing protein [Metabacillus fastidiosus]|uniref:C40 family peptidase n=1 Tax=Metabacillus fastidiosus TaxID=1458 RepID=UPI003D2CD757
MRYKLLGITATAIVGSSLFATSAAADSIDIKSGDTLSSLSKKYGTTVQAIKEANGLVTDVIKVGQVIDIPNAKVLPANSAKSEKRTVAQSNSSGAAYTVQKGDTLFKIARTNNTTVDKIRELNNLNSELIMVGQKLIVKGSANASSNSNTSESSKPAAPVNKPSSQQTNKSNYTVQRGDTLFKIANKFNISVAEIKVVNNLSSDSIYSGQTLSISGEIPELDNDDAETAPPAKEQTSNSTIDVNKMISEAKALAGVPYRWGGNTPSGFDCSGYIYYVLNKVTSVSRLSAAGYWDSMKAVSTPAVGDFVYFSTYKAGPSHMGIYLGNNEFIHASSSGVAIASLNNSYWKQRYLGARQFSK